MYTLLLLLIFIIAVLHSVNSACKLGISGRRRTYNVIGIYSMFAEGDHSEFSDNAVRFHLKLRYFIGRQYYLDYKIPIGYVSYDVCNDTMLLYEALTNIVLNQYFKPEQTIIKDSTCDDSTGNRTSNTSRYCKTCTCSIYSSNIIAIVSFLPLKLTQIVVDFLMNENIPHFAFATEELNTDKTKNPNFYSSYDLINYEILLMSQYIARYKIKHVALINIGDSVTNLSLYHQQQIWKDVSVDNNLCVQRTFLDPSNTTEMKIYIDYIRHDKSLQMIILWADMVSRKTFIELTNNITDRIWFWYTEYSFQNDIDYNLDALSLITHIFVRHPIYSYQFLNERFSYGLMKDKVTSSTFSSILNDKWIVRYLNEKKLNKTLPDVFKVFDEKDDLNVEYIETILLPLWWSQPFIKLKYYTLYRMWLSLRVYATTIYFKHGYNIAENKTYETDPYDFSEVIKVFKNLIPQNGCVIISCYPGFEPKYGIFKDVVLKNERYNWHCVECAENYIKRGYNTESCKVCPVEEKSNVNKSTCYDPYTDVYLKHTSNIVFLASFALSCVGVIFSLFGISTFTHYRTTPIVRASNQDSCLLHMTAHLLLFIVAPLCVFGKPTQIQCIAQPISIGLLLTVISAITLTKTQKSLYAFNARLLLSKRLVFITKAVEWLVLFVLTIVQLAICGISFYNSVPEIIEILHEHTMTRDIVCTNQVHMQIQLVYILILSLFCSIQAFRARNLPKHFNETKRTTYSMLFTILILSITFPISINQEKEENSVAITIFSITFINLMQLVGMYGYKTFVVLLRSERNTRTAFRLSMMRNANKTISRTLKSSHRSEQNNSVYTVTTDCNSPSMSRI